MADPLSEIVHLGNAYLNLYPDAKTSEKIPDLFMRVVDGRLTVKEKGIYARLKIWFSRSSSQYKFENIASTLSKIDIDSIDFPDKHEDLVALLSFCRGCIRAISEYKQKHKGVIHGSVNDLEDKIRNLYSRLTDLKEEEQVPQISHRITELQSVKESIPIITLAGHLIGIKSDARREKEEFIGASLHNALHDWSRAA